MVCRRSEAVISEFTELRRRSFTLADETTFHSART
jgi:hypothetical protein